MQIKQLFFIAAAITSVSAGCIPPYAAPSQAPSQGGQQGGGEQGGQQGGGQQGGGQQGGEAGGKVSAGAQTLIDDIKTITEGMAGLQKAVEDFKDIGTALKIQGVAGDLKKTVDKATSDAKAAGQLDEASSTALVTAAAELPGKVQASLGALTEKQAKFKELGLAGIVKSTVGDLQKGTDEFSGALGNAVSEGNKATVEAAGKSIDDEFAKALAGF